MNSRLVTVYRVLAWLTGVMLLLLVFVGVPLKYIWDNERANAVIGMLHGILFYPAYVVVTFALGYRERWSITKSVLVVLAGAVPFMSFVAERRVVADLRREPVPAPAAPAPPA